MIPARSRRLLKSLFGLAALLLAAPSPIAAQDTPQQGGTLRIAQTGFRHLNPAIQSGGGTGLPGAQIFAGLIEVNERNEPQPYLAESWKISDDGLRYTFNLVKDARFHDGVPITSADVAYSVEVVKQYHTFGKTTMGPVERVETPDPQTAVFVLSSPHPALLMSVAPQLLPIIPKHVYTTEPILTHPANLKPVGSGPFRVVEVKPGEMVILERNKDYFRKGLPYVDRIVSRVITDGASLVLQLEKGELDLVPAGVRYRDLERLKKNDGLVVALTRIGIGAVNYIEFNLRKPPFDDVRVRRAIAHTIDKPTVIKNLHRGLSKLANGPIHPDTLHFTKDVTVYEYDPEKAKKLLDEAGFPVKADGKRFAVTLDAPPFYPDGLALVADFLKPQLARIGIDVERRPTPDFATWAKRVSSYEYDMTMNAAWNYPDPLIGVHRLYLCNNQVKGVIWSNTQGYCSEKADALLNAATSEIDVAKRAKLYADWQKIISDDLPFAFTTTEEFYSVYTTKLKGVPVNAFSDLQPLDKVYFSK